MTTVLHVIAPGVVGGAEGVVRELAIGHHRMGCRVQVATVFSDPAGPPREAHPLLAALAGAGVPTPVIQVPARGYLQEQRSFAATVARLAPTVVHTHGYRADVIDGTRAVRLGVPVVSTVHGFTGGGWRNRAYERLQLRSLRAFDAVVAVSDPLVTQLAASGVDRARVRLVRNAVTPTGSGLERAAARRQLRVPPGVFHVGWVGRLSAEKGVDLFLEALARVRELPLLASIVGDGPEWARARSQAHRLGLDGRVRWHGIVPDAARILRAFDVVVLSSRTEGTPLVLLEAAAAGIPLIATRVGGVPTMIGSDEAILVRAGDPGALAVAIRAVSRDRAAAAARAERARTACARRFDPERWLTRYLEIYDEAARVRPASPTREAVLR